MIQFYLPEIGESAVLSESESGHCCRVLRMKEGDRVQCVDGQGGRYVCEIVDAHPKHVRLKVIEREEVTKTWEGRITLCVAPTKNMDRMEWLVEKCTEMGLDRFIPVKCARSERKDVKLERLEKIMVSAMKQSLKARRVEMDEMRGIADVLGMDFEGQKFICHCDRDMERKLLQREYVAGEDVAVLIGPEGDFTPQEVEMAIEKGWVAVSLGESRLRTETAGLFAVASVHALQLAAGEKENGLN